MWLICRFVSSSLLCCLLSNLPEKCKESYPIAVCLCACVCTHACLCTAHTDFSFSWSPCTGRAFHFSFLPQRGQAVQPSSPTLHWWTNLLVANSTGMELSFKDGHSAGLRCPRVPLSWLSLIWEAPALLCGCHEARAHITALLPSTPTIHRLRCLSAIRGVWRIEMLTSQKRTAEKAHRELRDRNFSDPGSYALPAEMAQIQTSTGGLGWNLRRHLSSMFTHDA